MKEGPEKDVKKMDGSGVKDGEVTTEPPKKKGKEEKPPTKVVLRRLPPSMTKEEFLQQVEPLPPTDYMYYVSADMSLSPNSFSRAYLNFVNQNDIFIFTHKFDNYVFVDSRGIEYPAVVEFAPFQRIPKQRPGRKKDSKCGTLESDPVFTAFLEKLETESQESVALGNNVKQHFFETNVGTTDENKVKSTPLLDYLRTRYMERRRLREEKRKKDLERKRAKDELRRNTKKPDDDAPVVKPAAVAVKPKTEDERLMEQQAMLLRKLLGLRNPACNGNAVAQQLNDRVANCVEIVQGVQCKNAENEIANDEREPLDNATREGVGIKENDYDGRKDELPFSSSSGKTKYSLTDRNGRYLGNGYWKRDSIVFGEGNRARKLWKQPGSKYNTSSMKSKFNYSSKQNCSSRKCNDDGTPNVINGEGRQDANMVNGSVSKGREKEYSLRKELLDENALEAFPTFEESLLHKLQKSIFKAPQLHSAPVKKESIEEVKLKFKHWGHDVNMKSFSPSKKKEPKKPDCSQIQAMKQELKVEQNGFSQKIHENDKSGLNSIYKALISDDTNRESNLQDRCNVDNVETVISYDSRCSGDGLDSCKTGPSDKKGSSDGLAEQEKKNVEPGSRFIVSNNLQLPKAFSSGKKPACVLATTCQTQIQIQTESGPTESLPKAFSSQLKADSRNDYNLDSSENAPVSENMNLNNSAYSIVC